MEKKKKTDERIHKKNSTGTSLKKTSHRQAKKKVRCLFLRQGKREFSEGKKMGWKRRKIMMIID